MPKLIPFDPKKESSFIPGEIVRVKDASDLNGNYDREGRIIEGTMYRGVVRFEDGDVEYHHSQLERLGKRYSTTWHVKEVGYDTNGRVDYQLLRDDQLITTCDILVAGQTIERLIRPGDLYVESYTSGRSITQTYDEYMAERERTRLFDAAVPCD